MKEREWNMVYPVDPDGIGTKPISYGQELKEGTGGV